jgi:hypothetical protein
VEGRRPRHEQNGEQGEHSNQDQDQRQDHGSPSAGSTGQPARSSMRRTGWLLTPSLSSSALAASQEFKTRVLIASEEARPLPACLE